MLYQNVLIIGLGLIGGSFAKALKKYKLAQTISAYDINQETLNKARETKAIDEIININHIPKNKNAADLIIICSPLSSYKEIFAKIENFSHEQSIIVDFGSVKDFKFKTPPNFIACHPIAGSHQSGFKNSSSELLEGQKIIICHEIEQIKDSNLVECFKKIDLEIIHLSKQQHDQIFALTSHLPQFLSFLLYEFTPKNIDQTFAKCFRLKDSDPKIWQDIFKFNQDNIEKYYEEFFDHLESNINLVNNKEKIEDFFAKLNSYYQQYNNHFDEEVLDEEFFFKNFNEIFFRLLAVVSYLEISDITKFKEYIGSGFKDFISLLKVKHIDQTQIANMAITNHDNIAKFFKELS